MRFGTGVRKVAFIGVGAVCLALGSLPFAGCGEPRRPDGGTGLLPVGAPAPDFEAKDVDGRSVRLSDVHGRQKVVFFYPKDGTPGCTKEACAFRDAWARYEQAGIAVFGVSRDSEKSHRAFAREHELPFPLASDESGNITRAYGVGSFLGMNHRVTFLVGKDGLVSRVWPDVDPGVNAREVLSAAAP